MITYEDDIRGHAWACSWLDGIESGPVVYYLQYEDRPGCVKIGTTRDLTARIRSHEASHGLVQLVAVEPGYFRLEALRHAQFAASRLDGEMFAWTDALRQHVDALREHRGDVEEELNAKPEIERASASGNAGSPGRSRDRRRFVAVAGGDAGIAGVARFETNIAAIEEHLDDTDWAAWDANPAERREWAQRRHSKGWGRGSGGTEGNGDAPTQAAEITAVEF